MIEDVASSQQLGRALLRWFDEHRRDLPWRRGRTPYRVWVSEIMLQQTRVDTVVPYYVRFLDAFPTVRHLAAASEEDVLKLWEGLGYYSRARNLHRAAREVVERFDGQLPSDVEQLRTLPGIGPYTAAAISSIAFNKPAPAVDGNVLRVIARLAGIDDVITRAAARRRVESFVFQMTPPASASTMTEALMELGALVCLPRQPLCDQCPWNIECVASERGLVDELPRRPERKPPRPVHGVVAVITEGERVFVRQRPADGLLGGLWEFPWVETDSGSEKTLQRTLWTQYGLRVRCIAPLPSMRHVFSHLEWRLDVFLYDVSDRRAPDVPPERKAARWVRIDEVDGLPFGRAHRRIADVWLKRFAGSGGGVPEPSQT